MTIRRLGVLVPEFRTPEAPAGGLATVAEFVLSAIARHPGWDAVIVSPRMSRHATESRSLTRPRSWLTTPTTRVQPVGERVVTYVGADLCDVEVARRWRRRALSAALGDIDAVLVVAGTPATFALVRSFGVPVIGQVATTIKAERASLLATTRGLRSPYERATAAILAHRDRAGVKVPRTVVVENRRMLQWARENGARDVELITPGVDREIFRPGFVDPLAGRTILSVGRFDDPRKDPQLLIESFVIAVDRHRIPHSLVLAGSPPSDRALQPAADRGLLDRIRIEARPSMDRLVSLYQQAELFVSSSSEEGLGLALVEAMACRVPVVATATEGARQVIGQSAGGRLVDFGPGLVDRLAGAIHDMVADSSRRRAAAEAALLRSAAFDGDTLGSRFLDVIEQACRGRSAQAVGGIGAG